MDVRGDPPNGDPPNGDPPNGDPPVGDPLVGDPPVGDPPAILPGHSGEIHCDHSVYTQRRAHIQ